MSDLEESDISFFVDDKPNFSNDDAPMYDVDQQLQLQNELDTKKKMYTKVNVCWNCSEEGHSLRDCKAPRNRNEVVKNRKAFHETNRGKGPDFKRYHDEAEQKYAHLRPGKMSDELRRALGLSKFQLPRHIYMMRSLGYPPGWVLEAEICTSSLDMFDAKGERIPEPDDEEGEIECKKQKYDCTKIWDYPGFNVMPDPKMIPEEFIYNAPPISELQSKEALIAYLKSDIRVKSDRSNIIPILEDTVPVTGDDEVKDMELDTEQVSSVDLLPPDDCKFIPPLPVEEIPPPPPPEDISSIGTSNEDEVSSTPSDDINSNGTPASGFQNEILPPFNNMGQVKSVYMGTPVLCNKDSFVELPSPQLFAKDMSELLYFENLPNSTGMYTKMREVLANTRKKVSSNLLGAKHAL